MNRQNPALRGNGPLCYCSQCKSVFETSRIRVSNSRHITFGGVHVRCPKGHAAKALDGTFDFVNNTVRLIDGPEITREILERAVRLVMETPADITAGELADKASQVHPTVGEVIRQTAGGEQSKRGTSWKMAALVAIGVLATKCSINFDVNRAIDQLAELAQRRGEHAAPHQVEQRKDKDHAGSKPTK